MDLSVFIRHSDPTKLWIGETDLAKREVKLLKTTDGRTVSLDPPVTAALGDSGDSINKLFDEGNDAGQEHSIERDDDVLEETVANGALEVVAEKTKKKHKRKVVGDASGPTFPPKKLKEDYHARASSTGGKSLTTICELLLDGSSVSSGVTGPPTVVFLSPTPNNEPTDFTSPAKDAPVTTVVTTTVTADSFIVPPPKVRVVSKNLEIVVASTSVGGVNADVAGTSKLNEPVDSSDSFYASHDLDSDTLHCIYLYSKFNVGAARQVYLGAESDVEIVHLKSLLSLKEAEAAEAIRLRGQLTVVEAADAAKGGELRDLKRRILHLKGREMSCLRRSRPLSPRMPQKRLTWHPLESKKDSLVTQKNSLEFAFELFRERMEALVAELDAQLSKMAIHLDEEFYPRFLTTISERRWFLTHGLKLVLLKCLQSSEYLQALGQAISCAVNKGIQDGLKARIDHGQAGRDLIQEGIMHCSSYGFSPLGGLKDDVVIRETSLSSSLQVINLRVQRFRGEVKEKRLLLTDVITSLVEPLSSKSLTGEASTSAAPITTLSMIFASFNFVHPTSVVSDQVLDVDPHNEDPSAVTFEKEELGTSQE
uniref:Uncharacterized protein n=1 Tax=Tanacetum cinerariifolium TaxID=118510 RepID=A0A6L2N655_TANCI|nr:hypothetical protein [Tanacetum cinerariifolium]GEV90777.1 hypothetical protein [Tanacetum cinerariifolium]